MASLPSLANSATVAIPPSNSQHVASWPVGGKAGDAETSQAPLIGGTCKNSKPTDGHLSVITGYKWDNTFYKWGYKYL